MNELNSKIESIFFVASKPLSLGALAKALDVSKDKVAEAVETLKSKYNQDDCGIHILEINDELQMSTNPVHAAVVDEFIKDEIAGELTKAQLETLTVIAYRGPITRPELEQIRGVNCSLILRNLLIRGLIEEREDEGKLMPVYVLSFDALRHLGITDVAQLPEFEQLHAHQHIEQALEDSSLSS